MTSAAVNRPTNVKQKEVDINQKLQFYGIYTAFANGKVPSNKQIDVALNSALTSKALSSPDSRLSAEGKHLITDLKTVIEEAKVLLLTKNEGNLLQDFIWQTEQLSGGSATTPNAPVDKETAKQHGNEALNGLRTLGTLMISNGQFRKLLSDATLLLRDIAGDAAQSAANRVNPSEDRLANIDAPAPDNTWHDVPDLSRENLKNQAKSTYDNKKPFGSKDVKDAVGDASQTADPAGNRDPTAPAQGAAESQMDGTTTGVDATSGAAAGAQTLKDRASTNISGDTKNKTKELNARTQDYLKSKMPQERREQTIWRLKKMIVEIQGHPDYQQAIETLLNLAETYAGHGKNLHGQTKGTVKGAHEDDSLNVAEADLRTLIERFANSTSMDDVFDALNQIYRDADNDPELKNWFKSIDAYIRKCLREQGFILQDSSTQEWNQLYDRGHYLLREKYRTHTDRIVDESKYLADQFDKDPQNKQFANSINKLFNDLGNDQNGKPTFKPHLIKDLTDVILPTIFENVAYVPIPRIEYSDPGMDAVVENLVVESDNLTPNVLEFGSDNYFRWGRKSVKSTNTNKVLLSVSGIQMDLRDVSYYIKKKQGFPAITDKGLMDIFMGGEGFSFKIKMSTAESKDRAHFFKVENVAVQVKHLKIKLKQSKFKIPFTLFKPLLSAVIRPAIQKVLEKQIRDSVAQADAFCYDIYQEVQRAQNEVLQNPDPENVQNIYQRYYTAAQKRFLQGKQKAADAKAATEDKHVNVAMTKHDSLFKDVNLPGGISTKATEYKELALKGDKWESPVFGIGSAKESTNLPKVAPIRRRGGGAVGGSSGTTGGPAGTTGTGAAGFRNEVGAAFDSNRDLSLNSPGQTAHATGTSGNTYGSNGTTLGANNPVVNGTAKTDTLGSDVRTAINS